jgi:hypothetical protein
MTRGDIAKSPVHATFDEAGSGDASAVALQQSNSETVIDAIFDTVRRKCRAASGKSFDALKANAEIGGHLRELKEHLGHGNFGREVETRLGIGRQWRALLMKVAQEWPDIVTAITWAKTNNRLTRSEYSVDGALALLAAWRRETVSGGDNSESGGETFCEHSFVPTEIVSKVKLIEYLKRFLMILLLELLRARRHIAFLESEIERLSGAPYADAPCADQFVLSLPERAQ